MHDKFTSILIVLLIALLMVPAVSAESLILDSGGSQYVLNGTWNSGSLTSQVYVFTDLQTLPGVTVEQISLYTMQRPKSEYTYDTLPAYFACDADIIYQDTGDVLGSAQLTFSKEAYITEESFNPSQPAPVYLVHAYLQWNESADYAYKYCTLRPNADTWYGDRDWFTYFDLPKSHNFEPIPGINDFKVWYVSNTYGPSKIFFAGEKFRNDYEIAVNQNEIILHIVRPAGYISESRLAVYSEGEIVRETAYSQNSETYYFPPSADRIDIIPADSRFTTSTIYSAPATTPTEEPTSTQPVLRTGTVTMTDNNGTTITGFNVTAVNAYTDESFTEVTESDVAVMTLPMDRKISVRNPQTGEYEEAPIGYYRFYGEAAGYKMVNEDGIQVAVMPEKYGTYQLCDILVTSESGYLTGKHLFQIRSRSDNSILQTGTISAKSATTDEWYNASVTGGIATIVLPYDTSNSISQYAGNYYVYATSPGYEDSDYGTQIVVMPHTTSEIYNILLTPIGGIPTPGNVTLRIQAFSETGPGVVNASIFIAGVLGEGASVWDTYTASSTGYLEIAVPANSTYDIVASGAGYYDSARRIEVFDADPPLIEIKLYLSGAPTIEPTTQPTGWPTTQPTTQPTGGIPDDDDGSGGFLMQAVRGIGLAFGVGFSTAKLIFGMLLALSIGYATAKQLRGGAAEFGIGLLGGTLLGVLVGLLPVWIIVVLLLVVGLYIGNRYVGGGANNG